MATMLPCQKTIAIPSWSKIDHRYALDITKCLNHKFTNTCYTAHDKVSERPNMWYNFEKRIIQGY